MANALNKVNSGGIEDGSIVNADVKSDAAIAGSKLVAATTSVPGSMSAADKTKLDGIATSATANPSAPALTGSTNNTITTVTGANAIQGEANLTFDGSILDVTGKIKTSERFNLNNAVYLWQQNRMSLGNSFIIESQQDTPFAICTQGVAQPIVFGTGTAGGAATERLRIKSDGTIQTNGALDVKIADGNLVIGTSGHGIDFSAQTASATTGASTSSEVLDHYEEGTWTANILGGSSTGSVSYDANDCFYTRIGRLVTVSFYISWSSGTGSGHLNVHGLPFTANPNNNQFAGSVMLNNVDWPNGNNDGNNLVTHTWHGVNYFRLYTSQDNGGWQPVQCDSAGAMIGTMTYMTS